MPQPQRKCNPELHLVAKSSPRIVLPTDQTTYAQQIHDRSLFRDWVDRMYQQSPELFPKAFGEGYCKICAHPRRCQKSQSVEFASNTLELSIGLFRASSCPTSQAIQMTLRKHCFCVVLAFLSGD